LLGHGAASSGGSLFVFGGRTGGTVAFEGGAGGGEETGQLLACDVEGGATSWSRPDSSAASSERPAPRSFQAMCSAPEGGSGRIFVFGGCGAAGRLNDLWAFDPDTQRWSCLCSGGPDAPKGRGGATLAAARAPYGGERLVMIYGFSGQQEGDVAVFDEERGKWVIVPHDHQRGDAPSPRSVLASAPTPGQDGGVFIFGGEQVASEAGHEGAGEFTADGYILDLRSLLWRRVHTEGEAPSPRGWSGCGLVDDRVLLFGGLDPSNARLGDTWALSLTGA